MLENKTILITGGAMGLGEAIVRQLAAKGARVAIVDANIDAAQALVAQLPAARAYRADVASAADMEQVCAAIAADFGGIDGAVNNAGVGGEFGPITACTQANWDRTIAINLTGVFNSLRAEIPHLIAAGGGAIVNMASVAGVAAEEALPAYIASKHGVIGLTKSCALDYGAQGIRCNAVCPSFVKTPMTLAGIPDPAIWDQIAASHPLRRLVTAEEVAETVLFLLDTGGITGAAYMVDGGITVR